MAPLPDYVTGTITLTNGSPNFTGDGTGWLAAGFREGDTILGIEDNEGVVYVIESITDNDAGTLTQDWQGATGTYAYRMRYLSDGQRVTAQARQLIELLGNGNLQAVAGLPGTPQTLMMFTGPGAMVEVPRTDLISGVAYDVQVDTLADRDAYDSADVGFAVLVSDVGDGRAAIYSKLSNTTADWSDPAYVTGPVGPIAKVTVGTTTTGAPGTPASVTGTPTVDGIELDFTIPAGEGFSAEGDYSGATAYVKGDVVQYQGSSWIALQATTGNVPPSLPTTSNTYWQLLARAGIDGAGTVTTLIAGDGISVDSSDPTEPIVSLDFEQLGVRFSFKTVADLLSDTRLGYSSAEVIVDEGDIVTAQGFRYEVAASGAVDAHETTAGGVKLYEAGPQFTSRVRMARADLSFTQVYLAEGQRSGWFEPVLISSLSPRDQGRVSDDQANEQGVFIVSSVDPAYVWQRVEYKTLGYVLAEWFGAEHYVFGGVQDSTVAFEAASRFVGQGGEWRWTGLHRITDQVLCRAQQSVGSFGQTKDVDALICADPTAFTGVNTAADQNITNAVFADLEDGVSAFFALGPVEFHDFTMYGSGYTPAASDGSKTIRNPSGNLADWRNQRGIKYSKHITTRNVTLAFFRFPLVSEEGPPGGQGNYYSKHINTELYSCFAGFRVATTDSYNTECQGCRLNVAQFGSFDVGVRNFKFFGGSVEGFSQPTIIRGGPSDITFYGTYFETFVENSALATRWLFECIATCQPQVGFEHCLVYLNHFRGLFYAQGTDPAGPHIMKSFGNRFVLSPDADDTADLHIIWHPGSSVTRDGVFMADSLIKSSGNTKAVTYVTGVTTSYDVMGSLTTST